MGIIEAGGTPYLGWSRNKQATVMSII